MCADTAAPAERDSSRSPRCHKLWQQRVVALIKADSPPSEYAAVDKVFAESGGKPVEPVELDSGGGKGPTPSSEKLGPTGDGQEDVAGRSGNAALQGQV